MINQSQFYQESGKINPLKQSLTYTLCLGLALVLGYIYSVITAVIPLIYLSILISVGLGFGMGFICKALFRFNHNRSKRSRVILAVIFGLMVNYFQWTVYILWAFDGEIPAVDLYLENIHWIIDPQNFLDAIVTINTHGLWEISGIQVKGFGLTTIWIFEFLIIMAGPILAVLQTTIYPYSELQQKWYPKFTLFNDFESFSGSSQLITDLKSDPLKTIEDLGLGIGTRHVKIHVYYLKGENKQYITFKKISIQYERDGKSKETSDMIVNNFTISNLVAEQILEKYENNREGMNVI